MTLYTSDCNLNSFLSEMLELFAGVYYTVTYHSECVSIIVISCAVANKKEIQFYSKTIFFLLSSDVIYIRTFQNTLTNLYVM